MENLYTASGLLMIAIPFLVQQLKKIPGIGNERAPLLAFVLGMLGGVGCFYSGLFPEGTELVKAIIIGVMVGGTSTGLYDVIHHTKKNAK